MAGVLYVVATPIGNLQDISARALGILGQVSAVVCEDTRVTRKLLEYYKIKVETLSYHHHSGPAVLNTLCRRLVAGDNLAYVSDAGTPGVSDPGGKLVHAASQAGVQVVPIPGPSAIMTLLSVSGVPSDNFLFLGFPPHKKGRQTFFEEIANSKYPVVFFESTHRIEKALQALSVSMPARQIIVARELTKQFETIYRGVPAEVLEQIKQTSSKGEFVVLVSK